MEEKSELQKLKNWYETELKKRDKRIDELEFQNKMLLKTSLKQSKKVQELQK